MRVFHNTMAYLGLAEYSAPEGESCPQARSLRTHNCFRLCLVALVCGGLVLGYSAAALLGAGAQPGSQSRPSEGTSKLEMILSDPLVEVHKVSFLGGSALSYLSRQLDEAAVVLEDLGSIPDGHTVATLLRCGTHNYKLGNLANAFLAEPARKEPNYFLLKNPEGCAAIEFTIVDPAGVNGETVVLPIDSRSLQPKPPTITANALGGTI